MTVGGLEQWLRQNDSQGVWDQAHDGDSFRLDRRRTVASWSWRFSDRIGSRLISKRGKGFHL